MAQIGRKNDPVVLSPGSLFCAASVFEMQYVSSNFIQLKARFLA